MKEKWLKEKPHKTNSYWNNTTMQKFGNWLIKNGFKIVKPKYQTINEENEAKGDKNGNEKKRRYEFNRNETRKRAKEFV